MTTRPMMQSTGDDVIAAIGSTDLALRKLGLAEAKFRSSKRVQAAVAAATSAKPAKAAKVAAAKPTGPGSRGGCPVKAACAEWANGQPGGFWENYRVATATMRFFAAGGKAPKARKGA